MNLDAFLYQYLVGGFIFLTFFFLAWRSGDYSFKNREDRATAVTLIVLFLVYFFVHFAWTVLAGGEG